MPDQRGPGDMWREAVAANLRYYEAWTRIASDWLRELAAAGRGLSPPGAIAVRTVPASTGAPEPGPEPGPREATAPSRVLVLEAVAGKQAGRSW